MKQAAISAFCAILAGTFGASTGRAELVANGNFNSGFTGWTTSSSGDPYYTNVTTTGSLNAAQIGASFADDGTPVQGFIQQALTTVVGQQYTITFLYGENNTNQSFGGTDTSCCYLDPGNATTSNDISVSPWAQNNTLNVLFGGSSVASFSNFFTSDPANAGLNDTDGGESIGDFFYQEGTATVIATSTSTVLEFDAADLQQNVVLTGISAVESPEPGTLGLLASALLGLGIAARRRSLAR